MLDWLYRMYAILLPNLRCGKILFEEPHAVDMEEKI
jgi:hypothetical protein